MNNSSVQHTFDILQGVSNQLSIDASILGLIMAFCFMIIFPMFIYLRTMNMSLSIIGLTIACLAMIFMGFIPLWIFPIVLCTAGLVIYKHSYIDDNSIPESYRDRLIRAYEAKFGGSNSAFNEEVDTHIKAIENLSKGYTRAVHRDKLKRLEKFVELKK